MRRLLLVLSASLAAWLASCGSAAPPLAPPATPIAQSLPSRTEPDAGATAKGVPAAAPRASATTPVVAANPAPDPCHLTDELLLAASRADTGGSTAAWAERVGARLIAPEDAPRAFTGITQEIVSAMAHRRYDKLAAYSSAAGICMRASKGAPCKMLTPAMLTACSASRVPTEWPTGAQGEPQKYHCGEAFRRIFYARDFLHQGKPRFNCFDDPSSASDKEPVVRAETRIGYVELRSAEEGETRSLWLVFDGDPRAPELAEMIAEYPPHP